MCLPGECLIILKELPKCLEEESELSKLQEVIITSLGWLGDTPAVVEGSVDSWPAVKHISQVQNISHTPGDLRQGNISIVIHINSFPHLLPHLVLLLGPLVGQAGVDLDPVQLSHHWLYYCSVLASTRLCSDSGSSLEWLQALRGRHGWKFVQCHNNNTLSMIAGEYQGQVIMKWLVN